MNERAHKLMKMLTINHFYCFKASPGIHCSSLLAISSCIRKSQVFILLVLLLTFVNSFGGCRSVSTEPRCWADGGLSVSELPQSCKAANLSAQHMSESSCEWEPRTGCQSWGAWLCFSDAECWKALMLVRKSISLKFWLRTYLIQT